MKHQSKKSSFTNVLYLLMNQNRQGEKTFDEHFLLKPIIGSGSGKLNRTNPARQYGISTSKNTVLCTVLPCFFLFMHQQNFWNRLGAAKKRITVTGTNNFCESYSPGFYYLCVQQFMQFSLFHRYFYSFAIFWLGCQ